MSKKTKQNNLSSSSSQSGAFELAVENPAIGSATINIGEEATLQVTLTNNGDPVTLTKGDSNIEFNVPSFIDLDQVQIEELSAPWIEGDKNPAQNSFTILCNSNGTWSNGSPITFNLTQIDAVGDEASTGNFTAFSADVLDYNTLSVPVILSTQNSANPPANLVDVLGVTLNNGGTIFVNDPPLLNQLTLNFKNLNSGRPIFNGTKWPSTANPQVYISFIWGGGSGALTSLDNIQPISLSPYETTSDWDPGHGTDNNLTIWTLSPPKDPLDTGKDSDILGIGNMANATFQFSDVAPIVNGATQMYVQVTGFPFDNDNLYNDFTFLVGISKVNPPLNGITYFHAENASLNAVPGQPLFANLNWQVFNVPQVELVSTDLNLKEDSQVYTQILRTDSQQVDLSAFYSATSIQFDLYCLDTNGARTGISDQTFVQISYPELVVSKFKISQGDDRSNPLIEIEINPIQLIAKSNGSSGGPTNGASLVMIKMGSESFWLSNTGNDPNKFIYKGNYKDHFTTNLVVGQSYTFQLNVTPTFGQVIEVLNVYVCKRLIGENYQGGIIFYLDNTGLHGKVAATSDQSSSVPWTISAYQKKTVPAPGAKSSSNGSANTNAIIAQTGQTGSGITSNYGAGLCRNYRGGGFNDWYLPSLNELSAMYYNIGQGSSSNVGNFANSTRYSSSTENNNFIAMVWYFGGGMNTMTYSKDYPLHVRAARAF